MATRLGEGLGGADSDDADGEESAHSGDAEIDAGKENSEDSEPVIGSSRKRRRGAISPSTESVRASPRKRANWSNKQLPPEQLPPVAQSVQHKANSPLLTYRAPS